MITIRRSDKLAIHIEFDYDGACALLNLVQNGPNQEDEFVPIEYDRGVTKKKRFAETARRKLSVSTGDDEIVELDDILELKLEMETIEYFKERLQKCVETREFSPAELCELFVRGHNVENDVYCIMTPSPDE